MEEKVLFPAIQNTTGGKSLPSVEQLHLDHGALAALLVPTPTTSILNAIRTILRRHNTLEEGPDGIYRRFEQLPGIDPDGILATIRSNSEIRLCAEAGDARFALPL